MSDYAEILKSAIQDQPDLIKLLAQAASLRDQFSSGSIEDDVARLHEMLVHNRGLLDRVQAMSSALTLRKSIAQTKMRKAQHVMDDAYMTAATKPTIGFSDYASAKEKDAHFALGAVAETMEFRKAENFFRDVEAAADFVRSTLRGMENAHRDLEVRIRLITLEGRLGG